jgi:hypothetical protein
VTEPAPMQTPDTAPVYEVAPAAAIEPKTLTATGGAGAGFILANFVLYLVSVIFYHDGLVPIVVQQAVGLVVTVALTFAGGYLARHVDRMPSA